MAWCFLSNVFGSIGASMTYPLIGGHRNCRRITFANGSVGPLADDEPATTLEQDDDVITGGEICGSNVGSLEGEREDSSCSSTDTDLADGAGEATKVLERALLSLPCRGCFQRVSS